MERNEESVQDNHLSQQQMSSLGRAAADDQEAHVCLRMSAQGHSDSQIAGGGGGNHQGVGEEVR